MSEQMPKPTSWDELFPNRFLKAGLMKGRDVTLTIKAIDLEKLPDDKGVEKVHGIMTFEKTEKQWQINKTCGLALKAMFGSDLSKWIGRRVTLFPTTDKFGGETVEAIRVRGSPDIDRNITFTLKLQKKKPRQVTLVKTDPKAASPATAPVPQESEYNEEPPPDVELPRLGDAPQKG